MGNRSVDARDTSLQVGVEGKMREEMGKKKLFRDLRN